MMHDPSALTLASWLDRVAGLERLSLLDADTALAFEHPIPAWAWALVMAAAFAFAGWSYAHLMGSRPLRLVLAGLRGVLVLLAVVLLCQPIAIRRGEKVEPDNLLVLVDRSASMQVRDMKVAGAQAAVSRDEAMRRALAAQAQVFGADALGRQRVVSWLGFGERAYPITPPPEVVPPEGATPEGATPAGETPESATPGATAVTVPPPDAPATALRTAIEQALAEGAGRPISGIVLITDGQTPQSTGQVLARRLEQQAVSVFAVPLGSRQLPLDLAITRVDAPQRAFVRDAVPVGVVVEQIGGGAAEASIDPAAVTVRLIDSATGEVLDERPLVGLGQGSVTRLRGRSELPGEVRWRIEVQQDQGPAAVEEMVLDNNRREVAIELIDRPIRVLYVEGYPRWEYRYLKNLLIREQSLDSSILLLSADRGFAQEGDTPITRPPDTVEEVRPFDVIILGDVPPQYFSTKQLALLRDQVAGSGAGLLWIGGQRNTPVNYAATRLSDLLPMRQPGQVTRLDPGLGALTMLPTPLAAALNVLELRGLGDRDAAGRADGLIWPDALPPLYWVQQMGTLKPTAEVLALGLRDATDDPARADDAVPLLVRLRYGAGQSIYVATDETWRWRFGRGELYFEQFWIQLIRMLGRDRVQQVGRRASLTVSHQRVAQDQPVIVELTLDDPALVSQRPESIAVQVVQAERPSEVVGQLEMRLLTPEQTGPELGAAPARLTYRATWRPTATLPGAGAGVLELRVVEPALASLELVERVEVTLDDQEWRRPEADHERLAALAQMTGGAVVPLDELGRLIDLVPNRARRIPDDLSEPIWNSLLALSLLLFLLTAEWIMRKVIRLA